LSGVATDAAVGEEIGRVGKYHVEAAFGIFGGDGVEEFEAVAVVKAEEGGVGVGYQVRRVRCGAPASSTAFGVWSSERAVPEAGVPMVPSSRRRKWAGAIAWAWGKSAGARTALSA
jgi:hypothetical protein